MGYFICSFGPHFFFCKIFKLAVSSNVASKVHSDFVRPTFSSLMNITMMSFLPLLLFYRFVHLSANSYIIKEGLLFLRSISHLGMI